MVRPTRRASLISRSRFGTMVNAALTSSPRFPALPSGLTKSFWTSTTMSAANWGSQRSFKLRKMSIIFLLVIVFLLQSAVPEGHDVGSRNSFARQQPGQQYVKGCKWVMQYATGKAQNWRFFQIGHNKHRAGQDRKSMALHFRSTAANALWCFVIWIDGHAAAD